MIKLAIIGSGAIAEKGYLPAASNVKNVVFTHVVDLDHHRAKDVAQRFGVPNAVTDIQEIYGKVNAAIVATPPQSHAPISIDCMNHGLHVLCEKPLANSLMEAKQMLSTQQQMGTHLAVGMVRRLYWSSKLLKKLVTLDMLGKIKRFDIEEGWEFNWPLRTGHLFQGNNNRGVIADTGTHLVDLILWILKGQKAKIINCYDDNWGGIEANAFLELLLEKDHHRIGGTIELSFTRRLRNTIRIHSEIGCLEASTVGENIIQLFLNGENYDPIVLSSKNARKQKNDAFSIQLSNFANSIINGSNEYVSPEEVIETMKLIDDCYRLRVPKGQLWEKMHLESFFGGNQIEQT